jgi:hypothetical protein
VEKFGAVAETAAGEVVVLDFDDQLGDEGLELAGALGAPAAGTTGAAAGEAGGLAEGFQLPRERAALGGGDRRCETDVVEQAVVAIEAEEERADQFGIRAVTETADDAIGGAEILDLLHGAGALAGFVGSVEVLGDDAVQAAAHGAEPATGVGETGGGGGEAEAIGVLEIFGGEGFEARAALAERLGDERVAAVVFEEIEDEV